MSHFVTQNPRTGAHSSSEGDIPVALPRDVELRRVNSIGVFHAEAVLFKADGKGQHARHGHDDAPDEVDLAGELLARVDAEGANPYADVIFGGGESSYAEYKHIFQDYVSPEDENVIEEFRNTLGYCTNYCLDSSIFIVNTDLVGDIEIKGYMDLLNPELKGRISMPDPTASSSAMMHIETLLSDFGGLSLENQEGWDIVRQLVANLDGKLASGSSAAWKAVADGEMVVALSYEEAGIILSRDGAPVEIVYPEEGTVFTGSTVGVINNCKNLDNAKLFMDFLQSDECQAIYLECGARPATSSKLDVANDWIVDLSTINYLEADTLALANNQPAIFERWNQLTTQHGG